MGLLAKGDHLVEVVELKFEKSTKGTPRISFLFEDELGDRITGFAYATAAAAARTNRILSAIGIPEDADMAAMKKAAVGRRCHVRVEEREFEAEDGEVRATLNVSCVWGEHESAPVEDAVAREWLVQFEAAKALRMSSRAKPKAAAPAEEEDDDLDAEVGEIQRKLD